MGSPTFHQTNLPSETTHNTSLVIQAGTQGNSKVQNI